MSAIRPLTTTIKTLSADGPVNVSGLLATALEAALSRLSDRDVLDICNLIKVEQYEAWDQLNKRQDEQVAQYQQASGQS